MRYSEDFFERLQNLMEQRGLSMAELARALHTQPSTLTRWKNGSKPQRNTLMLLAKVMGVSDTWMATGKGPCPVTENSSANSDCYGQVGRIPHPAPMSYGINRDPVPLAAGLAETVLWSVLRTIPMPELLAMVPRLASDQVAMQVVLGEVGRRATDPTTNVSLTADLS
jgi:transcriptional regulator with XRE-family HTH domain